LCWGLDGINGINVFFEFYESMIARDKYKEDDATIG
jgi:hypothetical protein